MKTSSFKIAVCAVSALCLIMTAACSSSKKSHKHELVCHAATAADCVNGGNTEYWECTDCGKLFSDQNAATEITSAATQALGHSLVHRTAVPADCENDGTAEYWECSVCGKLFFDEEAQTETDSVTVEASGHDWGEWNYNITQHYRLCANNSSETQFEDHELDEDNHCEICGYTYSGTATDGLEYTQLSSTYGGGYSVSKGTATDTDIAIPYYYKGKPVTVIDTSAFESAQITSVSIPDSVTSIYSKAFYGSKLTGGLVIPDSVKSIGTNAFAACTSLTEAVLGDGLTSISASAFSGCTALEKVVIGDGVTTISQAAFFNCKSLVTVVIGSGIKTNDAINASSPSACAFSNCSNLKYVYYHGTEAEWNKVGTITNSYNSDLKKATIYFYSESEPVTSGSFWHYDGDGEIAIW